MVGLPPPKSGHCGDRQLSCRLVPRTDLGYALDRIVARFRQNVGDPNLQINIIECGSAAASLSAWQACGRSRQAAI